MHSAFADLVHRGELDLPQPGSGGTLERFDALVHLGRRDLVLARLGEGHADAMAIITELARTAGTVGTGGPGETELVPAGSIWGVWAAVPNAVTATEVDGQWRLAGDRPWCSGAGTCTHAVVTANASDGPRLFAVEVRPPSAMALPDTWPAVGMADSDSRTVRFADAPATPIGGPDEYVNRPGFWQGSAGVAACWYGGALGVADALRAAARQRELDPHALAHLGGCDAALAAGAATLREAAAYIDAHPKEQNPRLARQVRAVVESCALEVMDRVGRALGAGPLCLDPAHARRVADLTVYLRQSHAERDLAELGRLATVGELPW